MAIRLAIEPPRRSTARAVKRLDRGRPSWRQPALVVGRLGRETLWRELAAVRWGPARDDPTPGIVNDRPLSEDAACRKPCSRERIGPTPTP